MVVPSTKSKRIVIGASAFSAPFISKAEEEEPLLGGDDIILFSVEVLVEGLKEEKQLVLPSKLL